jgi:hypothetical protein
MLAVKQPITESLKDLGDLAELRLQEEPGKRRRRL